MAKVRSSSSGECDDAHLVRMLKEGRRDAFAELLERYGGRLLALAERILQDRDDALESTQEVLLTVYQHIGTLRKSAKLRAWLTTIARNHAWEKLRRRRHEPAVLQIGLGTVVFDAVASTPDGNLPAQESAEIRELRAEIGTALEKLSREHEEVIRMFYLEGTGLPEIANRMGIPLGTAKWRLSRARETLREELMMSELTDTYRHGCESAPLLDVKAIHGWGGDANRELRPWEVCKTLLAQQVLFCLRKALKTPEETAREVKADATYVRDHLTRMTEAEVLEEEDGKYRANCILLDKEDIAHLKKELTQRGDAVATVVKKHESALSKAIGQTNPIRQGFDEGYLRWIVIPPMVLNFGISRRLEEVREVKVEPPPRPCGGKWFFMPVLHDYHLPWELGCNCNLGPNGHAQYWNSDLGVPITRITGDESFFLHRLDKGPIRRGSCSGSDGNGHLGSGG